MNTTTQHRPEATPSPGQAIQHSPSGSIGWMADTLRHRWGAGAWYLFTVALGFATLAPILMYYQQAFVDGGAAIREVASMPGIFAVLRMTVLLAAGSTILAVVSALVLAVLVMQVPERWRGFAAFVPQLPLVVPPVAGIIGWIFIFAPKVGYGNALLRELPFFDGATGPVDVYSIPAIIIIVGIELSGIVFAFVYARMHEMGGTVAAAARVSGASPTRTFFTVTLPLLRPSLVASTVVVFLLGVGQFTAPLLLGRSKGIDVLTTEIFRVREAFPIDYAVTAALGLPLVVIGVISILVQRAVIGDQRRYMTQTGSRGMAARESRGALLAVFGYGFVTVFLPLLALVGVAFSPFWSGDLSPGNFTTHHIESVLANPKVHQSVQNSLVTSLLAAAIVIPLGFVSALALSGVVRAPRPVRAILDFIFLSPLAVPRALLGMAILFVFLRPEFGLYGTTTLFVIGYAFIVLPFSLRSQLASLVGVHSSIFEAARVSGAGQFRTVLQIALPLTSRGITAALAIMMILLSHDFAVSVMLRSPGNHVMGTLIYEYWETGTFPQVACMALIMTAVTGLLLGLILWLGEKSALSNL